MRYVLVCLIVEAGDGGTKGGGRGRKCFRMVGGVLVERTVGTVLPALSANHEQVPPLTFPSPLPFLSSLAFTLLFLNLQSCHFPSFNREKNLWIFLLCSLPCYVLWSFALVMYGQWSNKFYSALCLDLFVCFFDTFISLLIGCFSDLLFVWVTCLSHCWLVVEWPVFLSADWLFEWPVYISADWLQLSKLSEVLGQQLEAKGKDLQDYRERCQIRVRGRDERGAAPSTSGGARQRGCWWGSHSEGGGREGAAPSSAGGQGNGGAGGGVLVLVGRWKQTWIWGVNVTRS